MSDYDSIKGIFMRKVDLTTEFTKNGFYHESNNDYYQAKKCYEEAFKWSQLNQVPKIEEELWQQSLLRCCRELTDWKSMCEWSMDGTDLKGLFTDDPYSIEHIFPYAFRSKLKLILQEDIEEQKKHQDLIKFLQELDSDGKKYLEQSFSMEMALVNLHQKDYNAAKYYAHMAIQKYLNEWTSINKTIVQGRITKLQSLQSIIELNEFLKFIDTNQTYSSGFNRKVENLINLWSNSMPNMYSDPPCTWDDVISNRCIYYEFIEDKYYSESLSNGNELLEMSSFVINKDYDEEENVETGDSFAKIKKRMRQKLEKNKLLMKIKFAEAAQFQGNSKLALNKLQQTRFILKEHSKDVAGLKINWMHW